jgi:hypothetical protein
MADYFPLVARAVQGLEIKSANRRHMLYERARTALVTQLRLVSPRLDDQEITRERLALEEAIRKVERQSTIASIPYYIASSSVAQSRHFPPPALAEFILASFTKPSHREGILQAAEEAYCRNLDVNGQRRATYLYWSSVLWSIAPLAWRMAKRVGWVSAMIAAVLKIFR